MSKVSETREVINYIAKKLETGHMDVNQANLHILYDIAKSLAEIADTLKRRN